MMQMARNKMFATYLIVLLIFSMFPVSYAQIVYGDGQTDKPTQRLDRVSVQSCNCVAFRLDDIQGYWLNNAQIAVMEEFQSRDIPLTIGIIGGDSFQFGIDPKITGHVRDALSENSKIKIANHGLNHENFTTHDQKMQSDLLKKSNGRLSEILGITPKTFIPPFNEFDDNTVLALGENGFTHFSPSLITGSPPYLLNNSSLYSFPKTATTGEIVESGLFEGVNPERTFDDIQTGLDNFGFAVVTMHPQEFSVIENGTYANLVNDRQIDELVLLIKKIQDSGLKIVFLENIDKNAQLYDVLIPEWFEKNLQWRNEEKITHAELSDAVNYLKRQGIVKLGTVDNAES